MANHYNAFISYRHHPDDIRVASDIHRSLERFRVPKDIRKQGKCITRLFRDKDELPITSSLTNDIYEALENSDYLIVICSVHTKESVWVQREIETFLKTHHRSKVLTVLASGEPYDVIPEILLREQVTDPNTGHVQWVDIEPLSCDWRLKRKQAVREELPRLAAALLGCGYDDLRQRQRQYRMRRTVAIFSAALAASIALSVYFLQTSIRIQRANEELHEANIQIQENLYQALRNQSEYLASVSKERMESGDRLTAIALALEALPDDTSNRPYVPSAENALSNALKSYQSQTNISAVGAMDGDSAVNQFCVTEDGAYIYILDTRGVITVWDTATFQRISLIDASEHNPTSLTVTPKGDVLFQSRQYGSSLLCYGTDGALNWSVPYCDDFAFHNGKTSLMILQNDYSGSLRILFVNPITCEETREPLTLQNWDDGTLIQSFWEDSYLPGTEVTLRCGLGLEKIVCIVDTDTGEMKELFRLDTAFSSGAKNINAVSALDNDHILIMISDGSGTYNGNYGTFQIYSPATAEIICYRLSSNQILWRSEITTYVFSNQYTMVQIPGSTNLFCQSGNTFQVLDKETGHLIMQCQTPSNPVTVAVDAEAAWGVLENGQFYEYIFEDKNCSTIPMLDGTVTWAEVRNGAYVLTSLSSQVQVYRNIKDDRGSILEGEYNLSTSKTIQHDTNVVLMDSKKIHLFDLNQQRLIWSNDVSYSDRLLGFSDDKASILIWDDKENNIKSLDTVSGVTSTIEIPLNLEDVYTVCSSEIFFCNNALFYVLSSENSRAMLKFDLDTQDMQKWNLTPPETMEYGNAVQIFHADENRVWFWHRDGVVKILNMTDGSEHTLFDTAPSFPAAAWDQEIETVALALGHEIFLLNPDGTKKTSFSLNDRKGVSLYFYNQELLVLCDDGTLWRYDLQGNMRSKTAINIYNTFSSKVSSISTEPLDITWHETADGSLILNALGAGSLLDCQQWQCRAFISNILNYVSATDQILCLSGGKLYIYHPYSTAEQIRHAKQILGRYELNEEQKTYYGID